jgi:glycosyltransferase involved in cell wall biosynthesis
MYNGKKISVILPTYNEEKSIARVINDFFDTGFVDEVIAVDNNARGTTAEEIKKTRARYVKETKQGYGYAIMRGLNEATGDLFIMSEADGTFIAKDIEKFLIYYSKDFETVWGTRTSRALIWSGAFMPFSVRFGNWAVAKLLEVLHNGPTLTDVGCTYKLISRSGFNKIKDLFDRSDGSGTFSPELMIWLIRRGVKPVEIPINYKQRIGESMYTGNVWKAAKLGFKMIWLIFTYRFKKI